MARLLYTLFYYLITPLILLRLGYRAIKAPAYGRRILERFGLFGASPQPGGIWVHAVSVGEAIAAAPMIKQLQQRYPQLPITVTTMTPTGSERVQALFGDSVFHVYAPYDLPAAVNRFLRRVQPRLLIIMETELWPNTVYCSRRQGVPVLLANARLSEKSAGGYQKLSALTADMLQGLNTVAAQTRADADRFLALGLPAAAVSVTGSIKFDIEIAEDIHQQAAALKAVWSDGGRRKIVIAASTHEGEDEPILDAVVALPERDRPLLILVPRHPERFDAVAKLCQRRGLALARRSQGQQPESATEIYLGDTMGEMLLLLGVADIAVVGGSLVANGGHNMLEPAAWGLPVLTGDSDFNFLEISQRLQDCGGLRKVADAGALSEALALWLQDEATAKSAGRAGREFIEANRGALAALLALVDELL